MTDSAFTLRNFFSLPADCIRDPTLEQWAKIEQDVTNDFQGINWKASMPSVAPKIDGLFDIEIPNLFVAAWNKSAEIQKARYESSSSPEEVRWVELAKHSIVSEHHPYVEMTIKNTPPIKIVELTVKLTMTLKSFQLKIHKGVIREIGTGTCFAEGTIEYKGLELKKQQLTPIKLPGTMILNSNDPMPES